MKEIDNRPILVSICSIAYNQANYIRYCLDGFLMQECDFRYEIIINDDCSTDGTTEIIKEYAEKYPDIILPIYHDENQYQKEVRGMFATFCFPKAKGKYIALCEGDDYWTDPLKLQKQVDFMEAHQECGLCYTNCDILDENGNSHHSILGKPGWEIPKNFNEMLVGLSYIAPMTWVLRKDVYNKIKGSTYHTDGTYALALDFFLKSIVCFLDFNTAVYRIHEGSASHNSINLQKKWDYKFGVYKTQREYAIKGGLNAAQISGLDINAALSLLPLAVTMHNKAYVEEIRKKLKENFVIVDSYIYRLERLQHFESTCFYKIALKVRRLFAYLRKR